MSVILKYENRAAGVTMLVFHPYGLVVPNVIHCQYRRDARPENPLLPVPLYYAGIADHQ